MHAAAEVTYATIEAHSADFYDSAATVLLRCVIEPLADELRRIEEEIAKHTSETRGPLSLYPEPFLFLGEGEVYEDRMDGNIGRPRAIVSFAFAAEPRSILHAGVRDSTVQSSRFPSTELNAGRPAIGLRCRILRPSRCC